MAAKINQFILLLTVTLIKESYSVIITPNNEISQILQKDAGNENAPHTFLMNTQDPRPYTRFRSFSQNGTPKYSPATVNNKPQYSNYNAVNSNYSPQNSNTEPQNDNTGQQNDNNNLETTNYSPPNTNDSPPINNEYTSPTSPIQTPIPTPAPIQNPILLPIQNPIQTPIYAPIHSPIRTPIQTPIQNPIETAMHTPIYTPKQMQINPSYTQLANVPGSQELSNSKIYSNSEGLLFVNNDLYKAQMDPSYLGIASNSQRVEAFANNQQPFNQNVIGYLTLQDSSAYPSPSSQLPAPAPEPYPPILFQHQSSTAVEADPPIIVVEEEESSSSYQNVLNMMLFKILRDKTQNSPRHRNPDRCYCDHDFGYFPQKYPYPRILSEILNN